MMKHHAWARFSLYAVTVTVLAASLPAACAGYCTTNYLVADTFMRAGDSTPRGTEGTALIGVNAGICRALLRGHVDFPDGMAVTNATLYVLQETYGAGQTLDLYRLLTSWDQATATWASNTASTAWAAPGLAAGTDYDNSDTNSVVASGWTAIDVTTDVQAFAGGSAVNNGWLVRNRNEASSAALVRIRTVEDGTGTTQDPYLRVEYGPTYVQGTTITNPAVADTQVWSFNPDSNYGAETAVHLGPLSGGIVRSLFRSYATNLPPNAVVRSAQLRLFQDYDTQGAAADVHRILKNWTESAATWRSNTLGSAWTTAGLGVGTDYAATATDTGYLPYLNYVYFDVADDVRAFLGGTETNYGWVVISRREASRISRLRTREYGAVAQQPRLILRYTIPQGTVVVLH